MERKKIYVRYMGCPVGNRYSLCTGSILPFQNLPLSTQLYIASIFEPMLQLKKKNVEVTSKRRIYCQTYCFKAVLLLNSFSVRDSGGISSVNAIVSEAELQKGRNFDNYFQKRYLVNIFSQYEASHQLVKPF